MRRNELLTAPAPIAMQRHIEGHKLSSARQKKQIKILLVLAFALTFIIFSPTIKLAVQSLFRRAPIRFGTAEIAIPRSWLLSQSPTAVAAWKPCITMLCSSSPRASFVIEVSRFSPDSDEVWLNAARKIIRKSSLVKAGVGTIYRNVGPLKCVEASVAAPDRQFISSCLNAALGLTSTFVGDSALKQVFYDALTTARKVP